MYKTSTYFLFISLVCLETGSIVLQAVPQSGFVSSWFHKLVPPFPLILESGG